MFIAMTLSTTPLLSLWPGWLPPLSIPLVIQLMFQKILTFLNISFTRLDLDNFLEWCCCSTVQSSKSTSRRSHWWKRWHNDVTRIVLIWWKTCRLFKDINPFWPKAIIGSVWTVSLQPACKTSVHFVPVEGYLYECTLLHLLFLTSSCTCLLKKNLYCSQ